MRLATRITTGILVMAVLAFAVVLVYGDRREAMGWPVLDLDHPLGVVGWSMPPLIALAAAALVLLACARMLTTTLRARREVRDVSASRPPARRR